MSAKAANEWWTRALVRITVDTTSPNPYSGPRTFRAGEILQLTQWGRAGQPVDRSMWSTGGIDEAYYIPDDNVSVLEVISEQSPTCQPSGPEAGAELS